MRNPMLVFMMLALAGCNERDAVAAPDKHVLPVVDPAPVRMPASKQSAGGQPDPAGDVATPSPAVKLALDGEGLRIFTVAMGSSLAIPFGTGKAEALTMLASVQGAPPSSQGENIDCGVTNAIWPDGLTVWFARDRFVGWSVASAASPLSTAGGLKVGTTCSRSLAGRA